MSDLINTKEQLRGIVKKFDDDYCVKHAHLGEKWNSLLRNTLIALIKDLERRLDAQASGKPEAGNDSIQSEDPEIK